MLQKYLSLGHLESYGYAVTHGLHMCPVKAAGSMHKIFQAMVNAYVSIGPYQYKYHNSVSTGLLSVRF